MIGDLRFVTTYICKQTLTGFLYFRYCRYQKCCAIGMKTEFVMTNEDISEMKQKANESKNSGIQSKYLVPTSYEKRCKNQNQVDLNGWEPDEDFLEWLLKDE